MSRFIQLLFLFLLPTIGAVSYKADKYSLRFIANNTDYFAKIKIDLKVNEEVKSINLKASRLITVLKARVYTSAKLSHGEPDWNTHLSDVSYDQKSGSIKIAVDAVSPKTTTEGAFIEIDYRGVVMNEKIPPAYYDGKNVNIDFSDGAEKIVPLVSEDPVNFELTVVTVKNGTVKVNNLEEGKKGETGKLGFDNNYVSKKPIDLKTLSFSISPPFSAVLV
ncbi:unnamed protein product [Caenorhabditis bovis]|uniref:Uncharacterized protein n=1 Tax=Caenorhabditis bovis TaxID=2654633 RepID=A0A8S1E9K3_9PELO|nr:unnamed protein product [Caenorhabditis bovis]